MKNLNSYPFNFLTQYFLSQNKVDENTSYEIYDIDARELLVSNRIDLIVKYYYIDCKEKGINIEFAKRLYTNHIEAFSNGKFKEPGNPEKDSIEKFLNDFDALIDNIKNNGFDSNISLIPVGKDNIILDGSHRVSCAAYFNKKVRVIKFNNLTRSYDYKFFKDRLLDNDLLDFIALKYSEIKDNLYLACIWPRVYNKSNFEEIEKIIKRENTIVYKKRIKLNYKGLRNFMIQIYGHQGWVGDYSNNFQGIQSKLDSCYDSKGYLEIYLIQNNDFQNILDMKRKIRDLFSVGNHSIHITDNSLETLQIARLLFNSNSIHHLNNSFPDKYLEFNNKLHIFKKLLKENNFSMENFIIDSSGVLGIYGIREPKDIDFLSIEKDFRLIETDYIDNHESQLIYFNKNKEEIINNPKNYFYYNDIKFLSLSLLKEMKKNRNEKKDKKDIILINKILVNRKSLFSLISVELKIYLKKQKRKALVKIMRTTKYTLIKLRILKS